jgi:hypothetical protein
LTFFKIMTELLKWTLKRIKNTAKAKKVKP